MSKHHNHVLTSVIFDVQTKTTEEIIALYGIEVDEDGEVYDPCDMQAYKSLTAWAAAMDAQRHEDVAYEKRNKHYDDDDY